MEISNDYPFITFNLLIVQHVQSNSRHYLDPESFLESPPLRRGFNVKVEEIKISDFYETSLNESDFLIVNPAGLKGIKKLQCFIEAIASLYLEKGIIQIYRSLKLDRTNPRLDRALHSFQGMWWGKESSIGFFWDPKVAWQKVADAFSRSVKKLSEKN